MTESMESCTRVRFWSGLRTIGGTIITVEHGQSRILFDFGRSFVPAGSVLESGIAEPGDPAAAYLRLKLLPPLDDLYPGQSLAAAGSRLRPAGQSGLQQAVFISHLHLDHMALMGMVDPSVPVWMSGESLKLYKALETIGEGVPTVSGRTYEAFDFGQAVICGEISVTPLRVDHDVAGACAFIIETPELRMLYTGDFRISGNHPAWTFKMAEEASKQNINVLIIEGTTVGIPPEDDETALSASEIAARGEGAIEERVAAALRETKGLAVLNPYHRNIERFKAFYRAAELAERVLVLEPETASLLQMFSGREEISVISDAPLPGFKAVTIEEINRTPGKYVLQNSFNRLMRLMQLETEGGLYIHSNGAPLGAYDANYAALRDFLSRMGLGYRYIGASGHGSPEHLRQIGGMIAADWYIPLHSLHPENLELPAGIRLLPEYEKTYFFKNGKPAGAENERR